MQQPSDGERDARDPEQRGEQGGEQDERDDREKDQREPQQRDRGECQQHDHQPGTKRDLSAVIRLQAFDRITRSRREQQEPRQRQQHQARAVAQEDAKGLVWVERPEACDLGIEDEPFTDSAAVKTKSLRRPDPGADFLDHLCADEHVRHGVRPSGAGCDVGERQQDACDHKTADEDRPGPASEWMKRA